MWEGSLSLYCRKSEKRQRKMAMKLLVWIVAGIALCSGFPSMKKETDKEEIVKVKLIFPKPDHDNQHSKQKRSSDMFPESLSFRFRVNNNDVIMDLEKNTMANVPPIMRVDKHRPIYDTKADVQKNFALYQGLGMGASALVRFPFDDISKFELHASYQHGSEWYAIEPLALSDRRKRSGVPLHTVETMPTTQATTTPPADQLVADHKVTLLNPDIELGSFFNDIIVIRDDQMTSTDNPLDPFPILRLGEEPYSIPMVDLHSFQNQRKKRQSTWDDWEPSERHRRQIGQKYVEYLVVLDYANFYKWRQVAIGNTDDERYNNAVNSLVQYYLFVTNGIDVRFQSAQTSQGDLRVTLAGFVIATDISESPWTENNKLSADAVYDGRSLEDFAKWINSQSASLPSHDHAALFTGHDLALSSKDKSTIGIAYLSRVCLSFSASVNQEPYNALSIHISAHELGHSLGATHDASNTGSCSSALHYVMAPRLPAVNETLASNPYEFSSCSRSQIGTYLSTLKSDCLSNVPDILSKVTLTERPGNVYPVDQQCHTFPEQDWVICRDKYVNYPLKWATICYQLECRRIGTSTCINRRQAYDGTPCGYMKWCEKGRCVSSGQSSSRSEICPLGDDPSFGCQANQCSGYSNGVRTGICCSTCLESSTKAPTTTTTTTTTTPTTTTTTPTTTTTTPTTTTTTPTTTTTTPTTTTTTPTSTTTTPTTTTTTPTSTTTTPTTTTTTPTTTTTTSTTTTTTPTTTTTTPTTTTTTPTTTTTTPTTTTTTPTTTTTTPTTTTTTPTTTTTTPTTTTTTPTTTTTTPTTTTTTPTTTTTTPTTTTTTPTTTTTTPTTTTTTPTTTTTTLTTTTTTPTTTTTTPKTTTTTPTTTTTTTPTTTTTTMPKTTTTTPTTTTKKTPITTTTSSKTTTPRDDSKDPLSSFELRELISHFIALAMIV